MTTELAVLGWTVVWGLFQVLFAGWMGGRSHGFGWNAGNRDNEPRPLSVHAGRAARAAHNFLETFPFFAAVVLALVAAGKSNAHTALAAEIYLAARIIYLPCYVIGIRYLRTVVWAVSLLAIIYLIVALLG